MLLSERVRIEVFIPDLPDPSYTNLFSDLLLDLDRDRLLIGLYMDRLRSAVHEALNGEEAILVSVYTVYHDE